MCASHVTSLALKPEECGDTLLHCCLSDFLTQNPKIFTQFEGCSPTRQDIKSLCTIFVYNCMVLVLIHWWRTKKIQKRTPQIYRSSGVHRHSRFKLCVLICFLKFHNFQLKIQEKWFTLRGTNIPHLGKRNIIDRNMLWEGICSFLGVDKRWVASVENTSSVAPPKTTCHLNINGWKMYFSYWNSSFFGGTC